MSKIYGVESELINEESLDSALEKVELPTDGEVSDKVGRIVAFSRKRKEDSGEPLLQCEECGGVSVDAFDGCPYCGAMDPADEMDEEVAESPEPAKATKEPKPPKPAKEPNQRRL